MTATFATFISIEDLLKMKGGHIKSQTVATILEIEACDRLDRFPDYDTMSVEVRTKPDGLILTLHKKEVRHA